MHGWGGGVEGGLVCVRVESGAYIVQCEGCIQVMHPQESHA